MKIKRFEDLECWKAARVLVKMVYDAINRNTKFSKDYKLVSQATSAAVSVMSNIAEGFTRHSNKEFAQFLFISKASSAEVQSILYVALDLAYMDDQTFQTIYKQAETVAKLESGLINYLLSSKKKPTKVTK